MSRIHIIPEGDSWFALPKDPELLGAGVTDVLEILKNMEDGNKHNYVIYGKRKIIKGSMDDEYQYAGAGDTIQKMAQDSNINMFKRFFRHSKKNWPIKAMIFSGGGNDLIHEEFTNNESLLLKPYREGIQADDSMESNYALNLTVLDGCLDKIESSYEKFITLCRKNNAWLITHSYCPPNPTKGGAKLIFRLVRTGPWFKDAFDKKGYPDDVAGMELRNKICASLINHFVDLLDELKSEYPDNFDYVDVNNLGIDHENDHQDEIHLTHNGCKKVAEGFIAKLDEIFQATTLSNNSSS